MPMLSSFGGASVRSFRSVSKRRLPGWNYGKQIIIPNQQVDANLTNFPVTVYLDSTNFDFSKAKADGSDIRFTDKDYNHLKFERKEHIIASPINVLYKEGTSYIPFDFMWNYSSSYGITNTPTKSFESNRVNLGTTQGSYSMGQYVRMTSVNSVNTTGYKYLKVRLTYDTGYDMYLHLNSTRGNLGMTTYPASNGTVTAIYTSTGPGSYVNATITLDISGYQGEYYPSIELHSVGGNRSAYIYEMWLEPNNLNSIGTYNVLLPTVSDTVDTEFYMWYGNSAAYNTSIEAWQDQTGKQLTYNGNVNIKRGDGTSNTIAYLYDSGNEKTALTGGWVTGYSAGSTGSQSKESTYMQMYAYCDGVTIGERTYVTSNKINLSSAKKVYMEVEGISGTGGSMISSYLMIHNSQQTRFESGEVTARITGSPYAKTVISADVSNLSGEFYIKAKAWAEYSGGYNITIRVTKVWIEYEKGAKFDGSGDYLSVPDSDSWSFGSGDFTIETSFTPFSLNASGVWTPIITQRYSYDNDSSFGMYYYNNNGTNQIYFELSSNGTTATAFQYNITISANNIQNFTVSKSGTSLYFFHNGNLVGNGTFNSSVFNSSNPITIGAYNTLGTYTSNYNGYIHGIRVTKGRSRYTANFTPPTSFVIDGTDVAFCTNFDTIYDSNYVMVQHMGNSLVDASGNGNNATNNGTTLGTGKYGSHRIFNASSNQYLQIPSTINFTNPTWTFIWLSNITSKSTGWDRYFDFGNGSASNNILASPYGNSGSGYGKAYHAYNGSANIHEMYILPDFSNVGLWEANSIVQNSTTAKWFIDSNMFKQTTGAATSSSKSLTSNFIGKSNWADPYYNGLMSNFRVSNIARSDAWIKLESKVLKNNVLEFADVDDSLLLSKEYELLGDITAGTATTSIDIAGLDIGPEDELVLVSTIISSSGANSELYLFVNNNTTLTNYYLQEFVANGTTITSGRANETNMGGTNSRVSIITKIKLTNNGYFCYSSNTTRDYGLSSILLNDRYNTSTFTISSITQLKITASVANNIGIGSRFQLYKINGTAVV